MLLSYCKIACILILLAVGQVIASADQSLESPVLQYRLDRLYFPFGLESLVRPGCAVTIWQNDDSLITVLIEESSLGVSYTQPLGFPVDPDRVGDFRAIIIPASIDSTSEITIGVAGFSGYESDFVWFYLFGLNDSLADVEGIVTSRGNPLKLIRFDNAEEQSLALEMGQLDISVSFTQLTGAVSTIPIEVPAPYIGALIPNPSRQINRSGFLMTSLSYRFNERRMQTVFPDAKARPVSSLLADGLDEDRTYSFDPERGRQLFNRIGETKNKITLAVSNDQLGNAAWFFADILSRDDVVVDIRDPLLADLYLAFVPVSQDNLALALTYTCEFLARDTLDGTEMSEALRLANSYIGLGGAAQDSSTRREFYRRADKILREEMGVVPLFRPTLFYTPTDRILELNVGPSGYLDIRSVSKLAPIPEVVP